MQQKGFTLINVLGLTIGLAASALIILYIVHELSFDRFHNNYDRIYRVAVRGEISGQQLDVAVTSPPFGPSLVRDFPEITDYTRLDYRGQKVLFTSGDLKNYIDDVLFADSDFLRIFTVPLLEGNPETALRVPRSILLSESMAKKFFANANPVGSVIQYNNQVDLTVTGVFKDYPGNSHMRFNCLISYSTIPLLQGQDILQNWGSLSIYTYVLTNGKSTEEELDAKLTDFLQSYMGEDLGASSVIMEPYLQPLAGIHLGSHLMAEMQPNGNRATIFTLSAIVVFILILAGINFMNLSTARSANRAKEIGIRKVLGCRRSRLIMQFLAESVLVSLISLVIAIFLIELALPAFDKITGKNLTINYILNWKISLGFFLMTVLVGIFAGSYPAFYLSSYNPVAVFQGKRKSASSNKLLRNFLVFFQFTISTALMIGTIIIYQQLRYVNHKELGFTRENVILVPLRNTDIQDHAGVVKEQFSKLPGVIACSMTTGHPGGQLSGTGYYPEGFGDTDPWLIFGFDADPDFIERTMDMKVEMGRNFSEDYKTDSFAVLINETLLKKLGWTDPIGKQIFSGGQNEIGYRIVGVLQDFHNQSLHEKINPVMIRHLNGRPNFLIVRTGSRDSPATLASMEQIWNKFNPTTPFDFRFLDDYFDRYYTFENKLGRIMGAFTFFAFFIAALGLFGLASYSTEQRSKEIGIRKVMGSSVRGIAVMLSWDFTKPILPAILLAVPLTYWLIMKHFLQNFAYRTELHPAIFVLAAGTAIMIALITVNIQTIRTAASNPVDALRYE